MERSDTKGGEMKKLIAILRKDLNLTEQDATDDEMLEATKDTSLRARAECAIAIDDLKGVIKMEIDIARGQIKKRMLGKNDVTTRYQVQPKPCATPRTSNRGAFERSKMNEKKAKGLRRLNKQPNQHEMQLTPQQIVDLPNVSCPSIVDAINKTACGNKTFINGKVMKKVSPIIDPKGIGGYMSFGVSVCLKCFAVLPTDV